MIQDVNFYDISILTKALLQTELDVKCWQKHKIGLSAITLCSSKSGGNSETWF